MKYRKKTGEIVVGTNRGIFEPTSRKKMETLLKELTLELWKKMEEFPKIKTGGTSEILHNIQTQFSYFRRKI